MATAKPQAAKPQKDYVTDVTASFQIDPSKAALVVVDMQYATGSRTAGLGKKLAQEGKLDELASERFARIENVVVPNLKTMLAFFRENGLRIIYLTYGSEMEDYSDAPPHLLALLKKTNNRKGQFEHEIIDEVKPQAGERVINKTSVSAFTSTGIDALLRSWGIEYLLFTGVSTNMCVGTTARDAADRGYRCLIIENCCGAAQDKYHQWEIVNFQRLFGRVESSDNVMAEIKQKLASTVSPK
jgi:nicotinamidase-related amidase